MFFASEDCEFVTKYRNENWLWQIWICRTQSTCKILSEFIPFWDFFTIARNENSSWQIWICKIQNSKCAHFIRILQKRLRIQKTFIITLITNLVKDDLISLSRNLWTDDIKSLISYSWRFPEKLSNDFQLLLKRHEPFNTQTTSNIVKCYRNSRFFPKKSRIRVCPAPFLMHFRNEFRVPRAPKKPETRPVLRQNLLDLRSFFLHFPTQCHPISPFSACFDYVNWHGKRAQKPDFIAFFHCYS